MRIDSDRSPMLQAFLQKRKSLLQRCPVIVLFILLLFGGLVSVFLVVPQTVVVKGVQLETRNVPSPFPREDLLYFKVQYNKDIIGKIKNGQQVGLLTSHGFDDNFRLISATRYDDAAVRRTAVIIAVNPLSKQSAKRTILYHNIDVEIVFYVNCMSLLDFLLQKT